MFALQNLLDKERNPYGVAYAMIRIFLGGALFIRGALFMTDQSAIVELVEQQGIDWFLPIVGIHYVTLAHLCGGFMMAIGLYTRLAALLQVPVLVGAVFVVHMGEGLFSEGQSLELSVLVLFLLVLVSIFGAGEFSFDQTILAAEGEQESARSQRIQESIRAAHERMSEEIRSKREGAASGASFTPFSEQSGESGKPSGRADEGRSILNAIYLTSAYGALLLLIGSLFVLKLIPIPQEISSIILGSAVVAFLLLSMFFMIYRNAIHRQP